MPALPPPLVPERDTAGTWLDAEQALLCSFGPGGDGTATGRSLRETLVRLGYRPAAARHLVRSSPLLTPAPRDTYRLRPFGA